MRTIFEDIKTFLPYWLNAESRDRLYEALDSFPEGINANFFTAELLESDYVHQGDLLTNQPIAFYPEFHETQSRVLLLSNTCDINIQHDRPVSPMVNYVPVLRLENYLSILEGQGKTEQQIEAKRESIRNQEKTNLFYIPSYNDFPDSVALFDQIASAIVDKDFYERMRDNRYGVLSQPAHYLLILKLSMHFLRFGDEIER